MPFTFPWTGMPNHAPFTKSCIAPQTAESAKITQQIEICSTALGGRMYGTASAKRNASRGMWKHDGQFLQRLRKLSITHQGYYGRTFCRTRMAYHTSFRNASEMLKSRMRKQYVEIDCAPFSSRRDTAATRRRRNARRKALKHEAQLSEELRVGRRAVFTICAMGNNI